MIFFFNWKQHWFVLITIQNFYLSSPPSKSQKTEERAGKNNGYFWHQKREYEIFFFLKSHHNAISCCFRRTQVDLEREKHETRHLLAEEKTMGEVTAQRAKDMIKVRGQACAI